jgi:hypothetical protein
MSWGSIASLLAKLQGLPSYVVAPLFTFLGVVATLFLRPRIEWNIEKKQESRRHRRELIAKWRAMVGDVSKELSRREKAGELWHSATALEILERHADYASFSSTYQHYNHAGLRGIRLWLVRSRFYRKIFASKPKLQVSPENTVMFGSALPARLHLTIKQIAQIEVWWGLHK